MDDKDIDDSGQHMVGIADTKALNLAVFVLEQCMRTCCRNMRLRSNASLLKAHHLVITANGVKAFLS